MYWMWRFYVSLILIIMLISSSSFVHATQGVFPEITSYAKVSKNGATSTITSEARNFPTSAPLFVIPKLSKLRKGEIIDYSATTQKSEYSTLDKEMLAKLDARTSIRQAQDRFHPPAGFEHVIAHSNAYRLKNPPDSSMTSGSATSSSSQSASQSSYGSSSSITSNTYAAAPLPQQHVYDDTYLVNYPPNSKPSKDNLPSIIDDNDDYSPSTSIHSDDSYSKIPDFSYRQPDHYENKPKIPSYLEKSPSKPIDYSADITDHHHSTYIDEPHLNDHEYDHHDHHYPYELIYDYPPDHHHHDYTTTTTEEPEMNDERLNKRPYSYYYIGKKLWYLPLYFSIYFIIYIAALVLKSIARHKINFPSNLAAAAAGARNFHDKHNTLGFLDLTQHVLDAIDKFSSENSTSSVVSKY